MGYSISQETYERLEANRAAGRLCQGSSRCSTRATRQTVALLQDDDGTWRWSVMVMCLKHADTMSSWPAYVNGAHLSAVGIKGMTLEDIEANRTRLEGRPVRADDIALARRLMAVDAARREAIRQAQGGQR